MMGELPPPQSELFYQFCLEAHIRKIICSGESTNFSISPNYAGI